MQPDGSLADSLIWKDIEGWPAGKSGTQAQVDLAGRGIGLVTADLLPEPGLLVVGQAATNVTTGNFNLRLVNFGSDDLIYMDDLGRNSMTESPSDTIELIFAIQVTTDGTDTNFNFDPGVIGFEAKDGGNIDIAGQSFSTVTEWQKKVAASSAPFVFGSTIDPVAADTSPPTVTGISYGTNDGFLALGEAVTLNVTMSEPVNVTDTPTIALANGGTANYTGGTGTAALTFTYVPAANQTTADLVTASSNAFTGTIKDLAGNSVTATGFNGVNPTGVLAVDVTAPSVAITSTATNFLSTAAVLSGTAEALAKISIQRDGLPLSALSVSANASGDWVVTAQQLGLTNTNDAFRFSFQAIDQAGNLSATSLSRILMLLPPSIEQAPSDALIDRSNAVAANDTVKVGAGDGTYLLGDGNDVLIGLLPSDAGYATLGDNVFKGGNGGDRFLNIGDSDVFIGGAGNDAVLLPGVKPSDLTRAASADTDALLRQAHGVPDSFLRVYSASTGGFYLSSVEYLEFAGDGSRIDLQSLYGVYTAQPVVL
jgi:hypothetical protein